jgi:hypothetical protein
VTLLERFVFLVLLLLLIVSELLRLFEDHILIFVGHGLDLCVLGEQCSLELFDLAAGVCDLAFLEDLPRLEEVLVILVEADYRLELLVLLLVELHELILNLFLLVRQGSNHCLQPNRLLRQILLLDAGLLEDAHVRQLLQLLDLLLRSQVQLIKLLNLLLQDFRVDWLPPCLFLSFLQRSLPLLLNSL